MGKGSRGLGRNQRGLRVGCCEMVGDYYDDSSVKENLNLLLRLTRVEVSVDLKDEGEGFLKGVFGNKGQGILLKGFFKGRRCWGLPQQLLATVGCSKEFKDEGLQGSILSRVVRRLREIQGETSRFKLEILVQEKSSYSDSKNPFHTNLNGGARSAPPNAVGITLSLGGVKNRKYSWLQDRPLGHVIWFTRC